MLPGNQQGIESKKFPTTERWWRKIPLTQITATLLIIYGLTLIGLSGWYILSSILKGWNYLDYMGLIIFTPAIVLTLIPVGALLLIRAGWILFRKKYEKGVRDGYVGTFLILLPLLVAFYFESNSGYKPHSSTVRGQLLFIFLNILLLIYLVIFKKLLSAKKSR